MNEISSIDELLTSKSVSPSEIKLEVDPEPSILTNEDENQESDSSESESYDLSDNEESESDNENESETLSNVDDYGNPKENKTYTEEELNERINKAIRDRLARIKTNGQESPIEHVQKNKDEGEADWEQQLERFIEDKVSRMGQKQAKEQQRQQEAELESQFRDKFAQGMQRFSDFNEVVENQPVSDAMTLALRGVNDPAAFIYAASKRHPDELQRISKLNPYSQMIEMGRLEERMRKSPVTTKTPKPLSKIKEDSNIPTKKQTKRPDDDIDALLAQSDAKRKSLLLQKRR